MVHHQSASPAIDAQTTENKTTPPSLTLHQFDVEQSLNSGELSISVSELLGCDYIFIRHPAKTLLIHERHIVATLNQLITALALEPKQKIFVSLCENANGDLCFSRFSCEWNGSRATQVVRNLVTEQEQIDFIQMIFDCSSPYEQDPH